jgi:enoyl-CoA hydratase/carnithine racemase
MADAVSAAAPDGQPLIRIDDAGVATLTLNRPDRYNTLSASMIEALSCALADIAADDTVKVVVIAARGRAFSTGHDLKDMRANRSEAYYTQLLSDCSRMMHKVQGIATAAGCQLVSTCDLAIAGKSARFATSGINYGVFCATPGVALSRVVARKHALEMLFTGDFIDADTAAVIGLVNRTVDDADLDEEVRCLADRIASQSRFAIRLGKASFYNQVNQPLDAAYRCASADLVRNLLADDGIEGLDAFFEKRPPRWRG